VKRNGNCSVSVEEWNDLLRLLPNYDPWATAGPGEWFDPDEASRAVVFVESMLVHIKASFSAYAGDPFILERWQKGVLGNLLGWKRADGTRRFREMLLYIPRKNGKSMLAAAICLYLLFCDGEMGAEVYCAAADRDQAALVFGVAKAQVLREPVLQESCEVYQKSIAIERAASVFKAISKEAKSKHGYNAHGAVVDELHAQPNRDLVDVLFSSMGARRQPLAISLTTADYFRPSICNEKYDYAKGVIEERIPDSAFLPVLYECAPEADFEDPREWARANPNLGVSLQEEYVRRECLKAKFSPPYLNTFKRLQLNIRTEQDVRWFLMENWRKCFAEFDIADLRGKICFGGMDLSKSQDLSAVAYWFPTERVFLVRCFVPEDRIEEREKKDNVPYRTWARQGYIEATPGNVIDYNRIKARVIEDGQTFRIKEIAYDRLFATEIVQDLGAEGFDMIGFGQGFYSMAAPSDELEGMVLAHSFNHLNNPVLTWAAGNVAVELDAAGNKKPSKAKSTERIDPLVACLMALGRAISTQKKRQSSYKSRELGGV